LSLKKRVAIFFYIRKMKLLEWVRFDSRVAAFGLFCAYSIYARAVCATQGRVAALRVIGKIFRQVNLKWGRTYTAGVLEKAIRREGALSVANGLFACCPIDPNRLAELRQSLLSSPKPFQKRLIILSPPSGEERGVLLIKFSDSFPYLRALFDLSRLGQRYVVVLEPSSCGYFDESILCLIGHGTPIVVQTPEPVDDRFLQRLAGTGLFPVGIGANCWADRRIFHPLPDLPKKYDLILVAIWADVKRHYHLFEALSKSRTRDRRRIVLVGGAWPKPLEEIRELARYYRVDHCVSYHEKLSQPQVNLLLNQSKAFLLLSKKEGFNKAIIEALCAGIPSFLLEGFNFGDPYPYINPKTGGFIPPSGLADWIDRLDETLREQPLAPSEWIADKMSPEASIRTLTTALEQIERKRAIQVNKRLELKVNNPEYDYVDPACWERYAEHYQQLRHFLR
jgi:hypothetical protein